MKNYYGKPMVEVNRGSLVESIHFGALAVVNAQGRLVSAVGDVNEVLYLRSSSKPFQTLPLVEMGGVEQYGLTKKELAITCASHQGTDDHVATLLSMHEKIGLSLENLQCGIHPAGDHETYDAMVLRGESPNSYRHNCSGKHTGMLAQTKMLGLSLDTYMKPEHGVQQLIRNTFAEMVDVPDGEVVIGIDGCSVPVFGVPLWKAAFGYARLCDPVDLPEKRANACMAITDAMMSHPDMISGTRHGLDTALMLAFPGKLISKGGADGYQAMGIMPKALYEGSPGFGITMKFSDGDASGRARGATAIKVLRDLGILRGETPDILKEYDARPITNYRGFEVGEIRCCFEVRLEGLNL